MAVDAGRAPGGPPIGCATAPEDDRTSVRARTSTAVVLLLAALVAGCSDAGGRYAATIDGEPAVATADVARLVRGVEQAGVFDGLGEDEALAARTDYQRGVLSLMIRQAQLDDALATEGVEVTDAEVQDAVEARVDEIGGQAAYEQALLDAGLTPALDLLVVRDDLLREALNVELDAAAREEIVATLDAGEVDVDPRLGTYDQAQRLVVDDPAA